MNTNIKKIATLSLLGALLALPVLAVNIPNEPNGTLVSVPDLVNKIVTPIWEGFIGFAVIMVLVAGFLFLSANGDPTKVGQARMAVLWAVVGIIVAIVAFSLPTILSLTIGG